MKAARILIFILICFPVFTFAGEIYGTIKGIDGNPLTNKVVQIIQKEKVIASVTTNDLGYFSVKVKDLGKCKLVVIEFPGTSFDVFSSTEATRYNLLLKKEGDKWVLKSL